MIGPACWLKLFGCFSLLVDDGTISLHLEHGSVPRQFFAIDFEHFFWVDLRQYKRVALCTSMIFEMLPTLEKVFFRGVSCLQTLKIVTDIIKCPLYVHNELWFLSRSTCETISSMS